MHRDFFMAGMPGSGKTTYLASLWTLLSEGCVSTMYKKEVGVMPEDCATLNQIAQEILSYKDIERTKIGEKVKLSIPLKDENGADVFLRIPDLAGEVFRNLVEDRQLPKETVSRLREADCILFFTYYKNMSYEKRIVDGSYDTVNREYTNDENKDKQTSAGLDNQINKKRDANESEVVELLLSLLELLKKSKKSVNIRFIMSAWDMVEKEYGNEILPEEFAKKKFPLLYQCIYSNRDRMNFEFWGVSAIGGNLADRDDIKRIQSEESKAIKVVAPSGERSNDLTVLLTEMGVDK